MVSYGEIGAKRYFLYAETANVAQATGILDNLAIEYNSHDAIQNGIKEVSFTANLEQRDKIISIILNGTKKVHFSDIKLGISQSIGTITATVTASDMKVGSTDQTATNAKYIKTTTDGSVYIQSIATALPAGTNNIGDVDIASALPAGTNAIGKLVQPSAVIDLTHTTSGATAEQLAANTCEDKVTIQADPTNTDYVLIGNSSSQSLTLGPGQSVDLKISDTDQIYVKRNGAADVTVNVFGS